MRKIHCLASVSFFFLLRLDNATTVIYLRVSQMLGMSKSGQHLDFNNITLKTKKGNKTKKNQVKLLQLSNQMIRT